MRCRCAVSISRIDHLGIVSDDIDEGVRVLINNLGCVLESCELYFEVCNATESFAADECAALGPALLHDQPLR